jgi:hypothetical protein
VIDKFLHAIESATIPGCDVWASDDSVTCGRRWPASLLAEMEAADA